MCSETLVGHRRTRRGCDFPQHPSCRNRGREAHDDPLDAAVADQQVRAEPDDSDGNLLRHRPHQELQVLHVCGHRQDLGWPACAEPDYRRKRLVGLQGAAEAGEILAQPVEEMLRHRWQWPTLLSSGEGVAEGDG